MESGTRKPEGPEVAGRVLGSCLPYPVPPDLLHGFSASQRELEELPLSWNGQAFFPVSPRNIACPRSCDSEARSGPEDVVEVKTWRGWGAQESKTRRAAVGGPTKPDWVGEGRVQAGGRAGETGRYVCLFIYSFIPSGTWRILSRAGYSANQGGTVA